MAYFALSLGVGTLSSNLYISFTLSGLVEVPSIIAAYWVVEKWGNGSCYSLSLSILSVLQG